MISNERVHDVAKVGEAIRSHSSGSLDEQSVIARLDDALDLFGEPKDEEYATGLRACRQVLEARPSDCGMLFYTVTTKDGRVLKDPARDKMAGHRRDCPICSAQEASKEAVGCFHRIMALPWTHVLCITLTTRPDWATGDLTADKTRLIRLGREYMREAHPEYNAFQIHFQHWKSTKPHSGWWCHLHITALCCHYELVDESLVIDYLPYWQTKASLAEKRLIWAGLLRVSGDVDLDYKHIARATTVYKNGTTSGGPRRVMHWLRYAYRAYIQDVEVYFNKHDWEEWTVESRAWFEKHQENCGRRASAYGVLSNSTRGQFIDLDVVNRRIEEHHAVGRAMYDPDTGERLPDLALNQFGEPLAPKIWFERVKASELVAHYHVEYWDTPFKKRAWVVYRRPPEPCTRYPVVLWK